MSSFSSTIRRVVLSLLFASQIVPTTNSAPPTLDFDNSVLADASLRGVQFVDPDRGWAVGDFGVILRTIDGGTNWIRQPSGINCRLLDLHFSPAGSGYVVGGWYETDTGLSRGVLLRTDDGGENWTAVKGDLPLLRSIRVLAGGTILVCGDWSTAYQGRVLISADNGGNWTAIDGRTIPPNSSISLGGGIVQAIDPEGVLLRTDVIGQDLAAKFALTPAEWLVTNDRTMIYKPRGAPAGLLSFSPNGGRSWNAVKPLPSNNVDWQTAHIGSSGNIWVAGTPGDRILRLAPQGTATTSATGVNSPLHALYFLDNFRGWAVGAYGTILSTSDGGLSWRPQREFQRPGDAATGRRAMVLGVAVSPENLPWSAVAIEALESGRRTALAVASGSVASGTVASGTVASGTGKIFADPLIDQPIDRTRDASTRIGGGEVTRWQHNEASILSGYRPSVLILGSDLDAKQRQIWLDEAVRSGVARVFEVTGSDRVDVDLVSSKVLPAASALTGELWSRALQVVAPHQTIRSSLGLQRRWDQSQANKFGSSVSDGLIADGTVRSIVDGRRRNLQILQARSAEQTLIDRLFENASTIASENIPRQIELLVSQTPIENRADLLRKIIQTAERRADLNSLRVYRLGLKFAATEFADSGLGRWSRMRFDAIEHSVEWRDLLEQLRIDSGNSASTGLNQLAGYQTDREESNVPAFASPFEREQNQERRHAGNGILKPGLQQASHIFDPMLDEGPKNIPDANFDLAWRLHPAVLGWKSKFGLDKMDAFDRDQLERLSNLVSTGTWSTVVNRGDPNSMVARRVVNDSDRDVGRPLLDGRLDDACWQFDSDKPPISISDDPSTIRHVRFAYDGEFIYVGLREKFSPDDTHSTIDRRGRDADLTERPRVTIELDVDRDFWTSYQLAIDDQGRTQDSVDGFIDWQPRWFVATKVEEGVRTVELAIRREDLTSLPPVVGDRWRVRVRLKPAGIPVSTDALPSPSGWRELIFN